MTVPPSFAQQQPSGAVQTVQTPASAPPPASQEPDYPDRRSFLIGIRGLTLLQNDGPDLRGGKLAATIGVNESLAGIGTPARYAFEAEVGIPITRTGVLYADFDRFRGDRVQVLPADAFLNSIQFKAGDLMRSTFKFTTGRVYLDDLLFPHKFPVSRLRFKSIWGIRYISVQQTVVSPSQDEASGILDGSYGVGDGHIFYPEFGLAMEYAVSRHSLLRVEGAGFAFPHHSTISEGSATYSYRHNHVEVLMGVKAMHFKTSPQKEQYMLGTFVAPFVGLRWFF
jgi:hypothetical protein